jgi:hypothetical protein
MHPDVTAGRDHKQWISGRYKVRRAHGRGVMRRAYHRVVRALGKRECRRELDSRLDCPCYYCQGIPVDDEDEVSGLTWPWY